MRKILLSAFAATTIMIQAQNPFFQEFSGTPHGTVPFDKISVTDYEPAINRGIKVGLENIDAIVNNPESPTFQNTIVALAQADKELDRVLLVFSPLLSALSDDAMMDLSMKNAELRQQAVRAPYEREAGQPPGRKKIDPTPQGGRGCVPPFYKGAAMPLPQKNGSFSIGERAQG